MLDRAKDWLDIEAILIATDPLDLEEILTWIRRLAGPEDPALRSCARPPADWRIDVAIAGPSRHSAAIC